MIKGFVLFKETRIPFVVKDYRMELFADDGSLDEFAKEYNNQKCYILQGQHFSSGAHSQKVTFLVEYSIGNTCYLRCYIIRRLTSKGGFDSIGFQSLFLDDVFRYKYNYLDLVRAEVNLSKEIVDVYKIPFRMNDLEYELFFRMGQDNELGLLEDFDRKGEVFLKLHSDSIQECHNITTVLHRLAMFMTSNSETPFKQITLYKEGIIAGWFYCPYVSRETVSAYDVLFRELNVMKYVPPILNNIALDAGSVIRRSVPMGHLKKPNSLFLPQRFMEQIMAFEYLFDKLEHKKAQDSKFNLQKELEYMFDQFPQLLEKHRFSAKEISERIKETRRTIAHGYAYYYDFSEDTLSQYQIILLDRLIRNMSLMLIGFTKEDIASYPIHI